MDDMDDLDDDLNDDDDAEQTSDGLDVLTLRVVMQDGTRHDVEVINPDMTRYDKERAGRKLPTAKDGPMVWLSFVAWAALTRERRLDRGMPFDLFDRQTRVVTKIGSRTADPTPPGPVPG